jgi:hypothetical protein
MQPAMSQTYVIPDIHGRYDLLAEALAEITVHSRGEAGVLITIGDYVDPEVLLDRRSETTLLWKRYPEGYSKGYGPLHVVRSHDNFPDAPLLYGTVDGRDLR